MIKKLIKTPSLFFVFLIIFSIAIAPITGNKPVLAQEAAGQAAHYIVFEGSPESGFEVLHYQEVRLKSELQSLDDAMIQYRLATSARHNQLVVAALETADGKTVYQGLVNTSPWMRGEWPTEADPHEIDGHMVQIDNAVFVVRLPKIPGTQLVFKEDLQRVIQSFDLAQIVKSAPRIESNLESKLNFAQPYGSPANRVDILVMGDGYTSAQETLFNTHFERLANGFYNIQPLTNYRNYTNMVSLFTASQQSGADHPPYMPPEKCPGNDNPNCCTDTLMQNDPLNGQMVDTAFHARYCSWGIHRLLVADTGLLYAEAGARYPDWDTMIVLVNDETYGGSATGSISVISVYQGQNGDILPEVAQHEFGHAFGDLADEYTTPYPGFPACSDTGGTNYCEANVTNVSTRANIKWLPWINPNTPIPTIPGTGYDNMVGLFQGARYLSTGMYRSGNICLMRSLGSPFCDVPTQAMVLRFYTGGWGNPTNGITMLEPGTQTPVGQVYLTHPDSVELMSDILSPVGGPAPLIEWFIDGVKVQGASSSSFIYNTDYTKPGLHEIKLRVKDITPFVKNSMSGGATEFEYSWSVDVTVVPVEIDEFQYLPLILK